MGKTQTYIFGLICSIVFALSLSSCKKDKLKGDNEYLVGNWNWYYSVHGHDYCDPFPQILDTITPTTTNTNYSLEFEKKGICRFKENSETVDEFFVRIQTTSYTSENDIKTWFELESSDTLIEAYASYNGSNLFFDSYPFEAKPDQCNLFFNYFIKI